MTVDDNKVITGLAVPYSGDQMAVISFDIKTEKTNIDLYHIGIAPGGPEVLQVSNVEKVTFSRSDTHYRPLFPDIPEDAEKIRRLVTYYNKAINNLGSEGSLKDTKAPLRYFKQVTIELDDQKAINLVINDDVHIHSRNSGESRRVNDRAVSEELKEYAASLFVPAEGIQLNTREWHMGDKITVRSDYAPGDEAHILLVPCYWPRSVPSAPSPYPVPEAVLIATIPVEHYSFSHSFILKEKMGQMLDGSTGHIKPGDWEIVVKTSGLTTHIRITIQ